MYELNKSTKDFKGTLETQESFDGSAKENEYSAPVYLFLASSLNVELVYSILKGVTQFGYLTLCDPRTVQDKLGKMQLRQTKDGIELTLNQIKIKNFQNWGEANSKSFTRATLVQKRAQSVLCPPEEILVLD